MFTINDDLSINVTRGDILFFTVTADDDGKNHVFQPGDIVRIKVYGKKDAEAVVLQKDFPVFEATEEVEIFLSEEDTKIGKVISKPTDYWYEVELNPDTDPQTIIGYDDDGAKVFKLFPEGKDIPEKKPDPEVIRLIDDELDMTSQRPVKNQAIARAVTKLEAETKDNKTANSDLSEQMKKSDTELRQEVAVERTRIDNLVSGATADGAEVVDVRVGADGKVWTSAGAAVREQYNMLAETSAGSIEWEYGKWDTTGPVEDTKQRYVRSAKPLGDNIVSLICPEDMTMLLCAFTENREVRFLTTDETAFAETLDNLGHFKHINIAKHKDNYPGWDFYVVLGYADGTTIDKADSGKCVAKILRGHAKIATELDNLKEKSRKYLIKDNIIGSGVVEDGYYDDDNVLTNYSLVASHTFGSDILSQYECVTVKYNGVQYGDLRTFDQDGNLVAYLRMLPDTEYVLDTASDVAKLTCAYFVSEGIPISVYGCNYADQQKTQYAERPSSGFDNFSVLVNYHETLEVSSDSGKVEYTDYGVLALPESYTSNGAPTRLIILCQGTGERTGANTNPLSNHGWRYFLSKGYAVMDMNGVSAEWGNAKGFPITNQHYCCKFLLQSYKKGYEYVTNKYNLRKDVFVAGISMGGGASALIVQSKILPVIAHVAFCPALSVYKQDYMNPWGGKNQQKTIAGQWGFDGWDSTTPSQDYFLRNIDKIKGFDNLLINTFGNTKDVANRNYGNDAEANSYNALCKIYPVPLKIWHCTDDTTVLYRYSEFMVNMIRNADGQAWLRNLGAGGHVNGWNAGEVADVGVCGEAVTTSIPFYESVLFMRQYE